MSIAYTPGITPSDPKDLPAYLKREFVLIAAAVRQNAEGHIEEVHAEPNKPRTGDIRFADGSNWNPGHDRGLYMYDAASTDDDKWFQITNDREFMDALVEESRNSKDLLAHILLQLQIVNEYNKSITDEIITEEDIEDEHN